MWYSTIGLPDTKFLLISSYIVSLPLFFNKKRNAIFHAWHHLWSYSHSKTLPILLQLEYRYNYQGFWISIFYDLHKYPSNDHEILSTTWLYDFSINSIITFHIVDGRYNLFWKVWGYGWKKSLDRINLIWFEATYRLIVCQMHKPMFVYYTWHHRPTVVMFYRRSFGNIIAIMGHGCTINGQPI